MKERASFEVPVDQGAITARVVEPDAVAAAKLPAPLWLFCHPGSSGTWAYFDLHVPGRDGYSFAEFMAERGVGVVAIDTLGTGDSRFDGRGEDLTLEGLAEANARAVEETRRRIGDGARLCGVGHSGGGGALIVTQATQESFDYLAVLGMPADDFEVFGGVDDVVAEFETDEQGFIQGTGELSAKQRARGYLDDVPDDVIAARPRVRTPPAYPTVMRRGTLLPYAQRVEVPVFVAFGEVDYGGTPFDEPSRYESAGDVTVYIQPGSAHWHNQAAPRRELWTALFNWLWGRERFRDGRRPNTAPRA